MSWRNNNKKIRLCLLTSSHYRWKNTHAHYYKHQKSSWNISYLTMPYIILISDNWKNIFSEKCIIRKYFIIDMYDQYVNNADKISHIMANKAEAMRKRTYSV